MNGKAEFDPELYTEKELDNKELMADELAKFIKKHKKSGWVLLSEALIQAQMDVISERAIDRDRQHIQNMSLANMAKTQKRLQILDENAKSCKAFFYKLFDFIRLAALPEKMENDGIDGTVKIAGVGRVSLQNDINATIPAPKRAEAYGWLRDHKHDIIQETVNSSTLKALLKRMLRDGEEIPEELFTVRPFTRAQITKV